LSLALTREGARGISPYSSMTLREVLPVGEGLRSNLRVILW